MKTPRIVLQQPAHVTAWGGVAGRYSIIKDASDHRGETHTRQELGEEFLASVIAERQCILQVRESCSMKDAAQKYHNPDSPAFKYLRARMGQVGEQPIYTGPELLLYIHGHGLATFLLAHAAAKNQFTKLKAKQYGGFQFWPVIKFSAANISTGRIRFYSPLLRETELAWTKISSYSSERAVFEAASRKLEQVPTFITQPAQAVVRRFNEAIRDMSRAGIKIGRRALNNLINEANDGDYFADDFDGFSMSDFH